MRIYKYHAEFNENRIPQMIADTNVRYNVDGRMRFDNSDKMYDLALALNLHKATEEYVYCMCLDNKMHLKGFFEVSHGTYQASLVDVRAVFQKALLLDAVYIAVMHNHPSGDLEPSMEDFDLTKKLKEAGNIIGIDMMEHIIVSHLGYTSLRETCPNIF